MEHFNGEPEVHDHIVISIIFMDCRIESRLDHRILSYDQEVLNIKKSQ